MANGSGFGPVSSRNRRTLERMSGKGANGFKQCSGKQRFPSKKVAQGVVRSMKADPTMQRPKNPGVTLGPYKCPVCQHWHVGHARRNG